MNPQPLVINLVLLSPEPGCARCEMRICDRCGGVGWECLVDRDRTMALAASKVPPDTDSITIAQTFLCRRCRR